LTILRTARDALLVLSVTWLGGCTSTKPIESHYPEAAVRRADQVTLDSKDIDRIDGYHNLGIVSGSSCEDQAGAEKMIRLEAAKAGATKVVHLQCWEAGPLSGCLGQTYRCKGKAISFDEGGSRDGPLVGN
jgi:hypothetical protein